MNLLVKLGASVALDVVGYGAANGWIIPEGSSVRLNSNDPSVASVVDNIGVPAGGAQQLTTMVAVLKEGVTDIHVTVKTPDGAIYEATSTLTIEAAPEPGLMRIELVLREVTR